MPALVANYQKQQTVTQLKKSYTVLAQAFKMAQLEFGEVSAWTDWGNNTNNELIITEYLAPYLKIARVYGPSDNNRKAMCYEENSYMASAPYNAQHMWLDKVYISSPFTTTTASFKLADGTCIGTYFASSVRQVVIDINGVDTKPNMGGVDLFFYYVNNDGDLKPMGDTQAYENLSNGTVNGSCNRNTGGASAAGRLCAAKIMADSWEIKDDYPW